MIYDYMPVRLRKLLIRGVLPDHEILRLCEECGMIRPYFHEQRRVCGISWGPSSIGYDVRLGRDFRLMKQASISDPPLSLAKGIPEDAFMNVEAGEYLVIWPGQFWLAETVEWFQLPDDVHFVVHDKSSLVRLGVCVQNTVGEPGWCGSLTLEITNHGPRPVRLEVATGIAQLRFYRTVRPAVTYSDRKGKYQNQRGVTLPKAA